MFFVIQLLVALIIIGLIIYAVNHKKGEEQAKIKSDARGQAVSVSIQKIQEEIVSLEKSMRDFEKLEK